MTRNISDMERQKLSAEIRALLNHSCGSVESALEILYETEAPTRFSRDLLIYAVAYRMQERALGGLKPAICRLLDRRAHEMRARRPVKRRRRRANCGRERC